MCRFTRVTYHCGHETLLTTPRGTKLCRLARRFNLRQGRDTAPAHCHPRPKKDINDETMVYMQNLPAGPCDACQKAMDPNDNGLDDNQKLQNIHNTIFRSVAQFRDAVNKLDTDTLLRQETAHIDNECLDDIMMEAEGNCQTRLAEELADTNDWSRKLRGFLDDMDAYTYQKVFNMVAGRVQKVVRKSQVFCELVNLLEEYDPVTGAYEERICFLADKLHAMFHGSEKVTLPAEFASSKDVTLPSAFFTKPAYTRVKDQELNDGKFLDPIKSTDTEVPQRQSSAKPTHPPAKPTAASLKKPASLRVGIMPVIPGIVLPRAVQGNAPTSDSLCSSLSCDLSCVTL
ncbi:hypothetical protein CC80DRAFT_585078 [Byssothecium circinans]|uniref:Uncharacterized protein n=1 Tax=Byssothecium circinans TaxID=147558 RepID=A0A6A5T9D6_9PLEO|nr:hypothetical protein CC80DRAFT_585078 [Byssothecium circinans]